MPSCQAETSSAERIMSGDFRRVERWREAREYVRPKGSDQVLVAGGRRQRDDCAAPAEHGRAPRPAPDLRRSKVAGSVTTTSNAALADLMQRVDVATGSHELVPAQKSARLQVRPSTVRLSR